MSEYIVYYKLDGTYYYYDGEEYKTTQMIHLIKVRFELHPSYEMSNDGLKQYYDNMKIWNEQIKSKFTKCKFDYLSKFQDMIASEHFCMMFCKKHIEQHDQITFAEQQWIESCFNTGLQTYRPSDKAVKTYSYDGKGFYQQMLSSDDFMIPYKEGYETILSELPKRKDLMFGFYRVKITSDNPNAKLIFAFNQKHTYYYYDLYFAMRYKTFLGFNIELIHDDKPNAYLYDSVVKGSSIFGKWNKMINDLKTEFPDNKLLKNLGSKVWGKLVEFYDFMVDGDELERNFDKYKDCEIIRSKKIGEYGTDEYRELYYLQNPEKPYKHNIRIKAQLTSYARFYIGNVAIQDIDNLLRIHTDSMSFSQPWKELDKKLFKREEKSSGLIYFKTCNNYLHECWHCHKQFKYKEFTSHKCW